MENNLPSEVINTLAIKIANLEVQLATVLVENNLLRKQLEEINMIGDEVDES